MGGLAGKGINPPSIRKGGQGAPLDLTLLNGFSFGCRPDCSLCCYATPSVTVEERSALLKIEPATRFLATEENQFSHIESRPNGGACYFLHEKRCRVHPARPFPCREYPLTVHIGSQVQATLVLACPGLRLEALLEWAEASPPQKGPEGLEEELGRVLAEIEREPVARWLEEGAHLERRTREKLAKGGRWTDPAELREAIRGDLSWPSDEDFPPGDPPDLAESWDAMPLYFEEGRGPVVFRSRREGWEALGMLETGSATRSLGTIPRIDHMPNLNPEATRLLRGYLTYSLQRDFLLWLAYRELDPHRDATLEEVLRALLLELGVQAVARGAFRAALSGRPWETLDARDVTNGIRAIDGDFLDQPTLGGVL